MGQVSRGHGGPILKTDVQIKLCEGLVLQVFGEYNPGEEDVNLGESFESNSILFIEGTIQDVIEWTEAQKGGALTKIEELCIEQVNDQR